MQGQGNVLSVVRRLPVGLLMVIVGLLMVPGCQKKLPPRPQGVGVAVAAWPQYGGRAGNCWCGTGAPATGKIVWQAQVMTNDPLVASPVIGQDGTVYVVSCGRGRLTALDGKTGKTKWAALTASSSFFWRFPHVLLGRWQTSPAIGANGLVYVASNDGRMYAFDARDGTRVWRTNSMNSPAGFSGYASPTIGPSGMIYDMTGEFIIALNGKTGAEQWRIKPAIMINHQPEYWYLRLTPTIGQDGTIYVCNGGVLALDPISGSVKWQYIPASIRTNTSKYFTTEPALSANGTLYFGQADCLFALDAHTGVLKWMQQIKNRQHNTFMWCPVIGPDSTVYILSYFGDLYAFDGATGKQKWTRSFSQKDPPSLVVGADGTLYVHHGTTAPRQMPKKLMLPSYLRHKPVNSIPWNELQAIDGKTGKTKWELVLGPGSANSYQRPAIGADGTLYVGTSSGAVYAVH